MTSRRRRPARRRAVRGNCSRPTRITRPVAGHPPADEDVAVVEQVQLAGELVRAVGGEHVRLPRAEGCRRSRRCPRASRRSRRSAAPRSNSSVPWGQLFDRPKGLAACDLVVGERGGTPVFSWALRGGGGPFCRGCGGSAEASGHGDRGVGGSSECRRRPRAHAHTTSSAASARKFTRVLGDPLEVRGPVGGGRRQVRLDRHDAAAAELHDQPLRPVEPRVGGGRTARRGGGGGSGRSRPAARCAGGRASGGVEHRVQRAAPGRGPACRSTAGATASTPRAPAPARTPAAPPPARPRRRPPAPAGVPPSQRGGQHGVGEEGGRVPPARPRGAEGRVVPVQPPDRPGRGGQHPQAAAGEGGGPRGAAAGRAAVEVRQEQERSRRPARRVEPVGGDPGEVGRAPARIVHAGMLAVTFR